MPRRRTMQRAEQSFMYFCEDLRSTAFTTFQNMKRSEELCDVVVKCGTEAISAHRVILAACMPYFRNVFTCSFRESMQKGMQEEVTLHEIDPGALQSLIDFAYCSELKITRANVQSLLMASSYLSLQQVKDVCSQNLFSADYEEAVIDSQKNFFGIFNAFQQMKEKEELCDVTIKCENVSMTAHRVILVCTIPYFRWLLTGDYAKCAKVTVTMNETDPVSLKSLIDFAYSSKVKITSENAQSLLTISSYLQLDQVKEACCEFISQRLDLSNVIGVHKLADSLRCQSLLQASSVYLRERFTVISQWRHFLELPFISVKEMVDRDDLMVSSEREVFEAVMRWVKSDLGKRHAMLPELLKSIRMRFMQPEYFFEYVWAEELIQTSDLCRRVIRDAKVYHLAWNKSLVRGLVLQPRQYRTVREQGIYVICHRKNTGYTVHYYDLANNMWHKLDTANLDRHASVDQKYYAVLQGWRVYVIGDCSTSILDLKTLEWTKEESIVGTHDRGVTLFDNKIYYFGGFHGDDSDEVRCYDLQRDRFLRDSALKDSRSSPTVSALGQRIYITGGTIEGRICNLVEVYDMTTRKCTRLQPMLVERCYHGSSSLDDKIYVSGGCDTKRTLNSAEVYDPSVGQWCFISSMMSGRKSFSLIAYDGKLFAFDGVTEAEIFLHKVEVYNPSKDLWRAGEPISCLHSSHSSVRVVEVSTPFRGQN